jgi:hypothetical protein
MILPHLLDPCSSPGQTAKTILLVSRRAGIDLSVQIIAVQDGKGLGRLLAIDGSPLYHPAEY